VFVYEAEESTCRITITTLPWIWTMLGSSM
jgi:hypothetical protein